MTDQTGLQVRDLLGNVAQMEPTLKKVLSKDHGVGASRLAWGFIGSEATTAVKSVLDFDVFDVVAEAWCAFKELHEYRDPARHPIGERSIVFLGVHRFMKSVHPILAITIGSVTSMSLRFTVELEADIRAVALGICNGHITSLGSGDGDVSASLKYGDINLSKHESKKVRLPSHLDFKDPGLPIL